MTQDRAGIIERLNIRGRIYRGVMRVAHRYGWHYAPKKPMPSPDERGPGWSFCWCQWCGMRDAVYDPRLDPNPVVGRFRPAASPSLTTDGEEG